GGATVGGGGTGDLAEQVVAAGPLLSGGGVGDGRQPAAVVVGGAGGMGGAAVDGDRGDPAAGAGVHRRRAGVGVQFGGAAQRVGDRGRGGALSRGDRGDPVPVVGGRGGGFHRRVVIRRHQDRPAQPVERGDVLVGDLAVGHGDGRPGSGVVTGVPPIGVGL